MLLLLIIIESRKTMERAAKERDAFYLAQENKILKEENVVLRDSVVAKLGTEENEKVLLQVMEL